MGKNSQLIIILIMLGTVVLASGCTEQGNQKLTNTSTSENELKPVTNGAVSVDILAIQKGPITAQKDQYVIINYTITNNGTQPVYKVEVHDQNFDKTLGTIKPGEDKKFQHSLYIPTDEQVKADFGPDAIVSNPFSLSGFEVNFQEANGTKHSITANSIEIKLV